MTIVNTTKPCVRCSTDKPLDEYHRQGRTKDGRSSWCKDCYREYNRSRYNTDKARGHRHKYVYGLTVERYQELLDDQGGVCAICKNPETVTSPNGTPFKLAVDHDHQCCPGKKSCGNCVRGLLCTSCNHGLGRFKDDPNLLQSASHYLASHIQQSP